MHHAVCHFDPGRETVDEQAPGLAFEDWQKPCGNRRVLCIHLEGCGQLAFEPACQDQHFLGA